MKFRFSLEKLLSHRKNLEDLAKKDLMDAQFRLNEEMEKLENFYKDIDRTRDYVHSLEGKGGAQAESLAQSHLFIKGTGWRIESQRKVVSQHQQIVEEKQEILRQATIECKMIERLKEKRFEDFKLEQKKKEQKFVDDMTTARFKGVKP